METLILLLFPSYISKIWRIDKGDKRLLIPKGKLRWPVTSIVGKIINPILSADITDIERVYYEKIKSFQEYWHNLVQVNHKTHNLKQEQDMNLVFYDHTLKMVTSDPIFASGKVSIIDTVKILKDYEMTIRSIVVNNRLTLLEDAIKPHEIDVNDLLNSLYGSYLALVCFWIIARNNRQSRKTVPAIAKISHELAISLDSYTDTLDIITNPEEMDMMKRAKQWERKRQEQNTLQNR